MSAMRRVDGLTLSALFPGGNLSLHYLSGWRFASLLSPARPGRVRLDAFAAKGRDGPPARPLESPRCAGSIGRAGGSPLPRRQDRDTPVRVWQTSPASILLYAPPAGHDRNRFGFSASGVYRFVRCFAARCSIGRSKPKRAAIRAPWMRGRYFLMRGICCIRSEGLSHR